MSVAQTTLNGGSSIHPLNLSLQSIFLKTDRFRDKKDDKEGSEVRAHGHRPIRNTIVVLLVVVVVVLLLLLALVPVSAACQYDNGRPTETKQSRAHVDANRGKDGEKENESNDDAILVENDCGN